MTAQGGFPFPRSRLRAGFPERSTGVSVVCVSSRLTRACRWLPTWCWHLLLRDLVRVLGKLFRGRGGDPERVVVHYCIFPDLNCSPEMDAFRLLHVEIIQNSLRCWVLQCHCRNGATNGHILATCAHNAFPRAYSVRIPVSRLIILEAVGSTFSRIVLRRNFDKTVYYKY